MSTPSTAQARSHHAERAALATAAGVAVAGRIAAARPWVETLTLFASYQLRAASLAIRTMAEWADEPPVANPAAFAGVTSFGFPISEPLISTIDVRVPAPVAEPLPAPWWDQSDVDEFLRQVEQLVESEVADAARSAAQVEMADHDEFGLYVRLLVPPSCKRCVPLANRIYRDLDGFERHDLCDCIHVPVASLEEARERGLVQDPQQLVQQGLVRGLSQADAQAILDGADAATVVNASGSSGMRSIGITNAVTAELFGRRVKATTYGTTRRARWRQQNPSRLVRLRPESIYRFADDHDDALRLLRLYGYLT